MPTHPEAPAAERAPRVPVAASSERGTSAPEGSHHPTRNDLFDPFRVEGKFWNGFRGFAPTAIHVESLRDSYADRPANHFNALTI